MGRSIRSALKQHVHKHDFEVIVVDDCSTDSSRELLETFRGLIRIAHLPVNSGLSKARNKGVEISQGDYILFLDADDYLNEYCLPFLTEYQRYFNPHAVSCDYILVNDQEEHLEIVSARDKPIACGILFKKNSLLEMGGYDTEFKSREEEDLKIRFEKSIGEIENLPLPLYRYRMHDSNMTKNESEMDAYKELLERKHNL